MSVLGLFLAAAGTCDSTTAPDTCIQDRTYIVGSKADESMAAGDCDVGGNPTDLYKFSVAQTTIKFIVTSTGGANPTFSITDDSKAAAENTVVMRDGLGKTVTVYVTLVAGNYTLGVSAGDGTGRNR